MAKKRFIVEVEFEEGTEVPKDFLAQADYIVSGKELIFYIEEEFRDKGYVGIRIFDEPARHFDGAEYELIP